MNTSVNCYSKILDYGCGSGIYKEIQEDNRLERDIWLRRFGKKGVYGIDIKSREHKSHQPCCFSGGEADCSRWQIPAF